MAQQFEKPINIDDIDAEHRRACVASVLYDIGLVDRLVALRAKVEVAPGEHLVVTPNNAAQLDREVRDRYSDEFPEIAIAVHNID